MFDAMTPTAVSLKSVHLTLPSRAGNVDILRGVDLSVASRLARTLVRQSWDEWPLDATRHFADGGCHARCRARGTNSSPVYNRGG